MAIETDEVGKKSDSDAPPPIAEVILDTSSLNVDDKTTQSEDTLRAFIGNRLDEFHAQVEGAIDTLEQFILSQNGDQRTAFDGPSAFDFLTQDFLGQLVAIAGGPGAPLMDAIAANAYDTLSWAQHSEFEAQGFLYHMRRAIRDACWNVRDGISGVLSEQWLSLVKLGYEGADAYIGPLLQLGLPSVDFNPVLFAEQLVGGARGFRDRRSAGQTQVEETMPADKAAKDDQVQQVIEEEQKQLQQEQQLTQDPMLQ